MPSFIPDGYTTRGTIAPVPGLHDGLEFQFRPMTAAEQAQFTDRTKGMDAAKSEAAAADAIVKHLVSWELRTPDGNEVPREASVVLRNLHPRIVGDLFLIVWGSKPGTQEGAGDDAGNS